jgi:uncharacterized protein (TIGR02453 family)
MSGRFDGFPRAALGFFKSLETHNDRGWFQAHKETYELACREPMQDLMAELEPKLGPGKIFRINRDIRFSRDKSPYKAHIAAVAGGYYVHLSKAGLYVGTGLYRPEPDVLARLRSAIDRDASGRKLQTMVAALRRKGYRVETHESLAGAPKGYATDHPRIDLLRMKDIVAGQKLGAGPWLSTRKALERVQRVIKDTTPFRQWLHRHVG